jgi:hypothetical protein
MINKDFIKCHLIGKVPNMDYAKILVNLNDSAVKTVVYKHYIKWHSENLLRLAKENPTCFLDPKYHDIYEPATIESMNVVFIKTTKDKEDESNENKQNKTTGSNVSIVETTNVANQSNIDNQSNVANVIIEDDDIDLVEEKKFETDDHVEYDEYPLDNVAFIPKINYKFRISSPYLPHSFELFQIKHPEFFSTVARFHLPIVRSYYDGSNVYITPSCISACMTLLNIDYKYFAGSKDPIEIINKYRMRGFGTILNDREIVRLVEYSNLVPKWKEQYGINIKSNSSVIKILGLLDMKSPFFDVSAKSNRPNEKSNPMYNSNYTSYNINNTYSKTIHLYDVKNSIAAYDTNGEMSNKNTINKYGYVNPVKKWLIEASLDGAYA